MGKAKVLDFADEALKPFFAENGYRLYYKEFAKEGKDWYLRIYAERSDLEPVDTDDCEKISRYLSEQLDREDPIEQNYYLEVSSPGMDRTLYTPEHFMRYIGTEVDVSLYKAVNGQKTVTGILTGYAESKEKEPAAITLDVPNGKDKESFSFTMDQVSVVKLTVTF